MSVNCFQYLFLDHILFHPCTRELSAVYTSAVVSRGLAGMWPTPGDFTSGEALQLQWLGITPACYVQLDAYFTTECNKNARVKYLLFIEN